MNTEPTESEMPRPAESIDHEFTDHVEYDDYDSPILFSVTYEGKETLIPSLAIELILDHEFGLTQGETFDVVGGGLDPDDDLYWGFAFEGDAVSEPADVIEAVEEMLDGYNEPPEDIPPEAKDEWEKSTIVIDHVYGV